MSLDEELVIFASAAYVIIAEDRSDGGKHLFSKVGKNRVKPA